MTVNIDDVLLALPSILLAAGVVVQQRLRVAEHATMPHLGHRFPAVLPRLPRLPLEIGQQILHGFVAVRGRLLRVAPVPLRRIVDRGSSTVSRARLTTTTKSEIPYDRRRSGDGGRRSLLPFRALELRDVGLGRLEGGHLQRLLHSERLLLLLNAVDQERIFERAYPVPHEIVVLANL